MKIIFATRNTNKLKEVAALLGAGTELLPLPGTVPAELPEIGDTLEANALQKARFVFEKSGIPCFSDDTGLEIAALDGRPGIYSARYAGENKSFEDNMNKVLSEMKNEADRSARFRTVIAFVDGKTEHLFEGIVDGKITEVKRGEKGFGYDPVFLPDGFSKTFAEMTLGEKNRISHRGKAFEQLKAFLEK